MDILLFLHIANNMQSHIIVLVRHDLKSRKIYSILFKESNFTFIMQFYFLTIKFNDIRTTWSSIRGQVFINHHQSIKILRCVVAIGEGFSRLGLLSGGPPLSFFICFSWQEGVWELDVPFVVCLLRWFFYLFGHGSFHFVLCIPLFWVLWFIYDWQGFWWPSSIKIV